MNISLNGEPHQLQAQTTVRQLIEQQGLKGKRIAVEINQAIVPRSQHTDHPLQEGDQVEIVHAIGGG